MTSLNRRSFTRALSLSGFAYLGFRLTGCGPSASETRIADDGTVYAGETVTMYDLRMEAWSTLGSGQLGFTGTLKASQIKENKQLDLAYTQDPHGHAFVLTKDDLAKLRRGQAIRVITTEALGHKHEVRIDPVKNRVPGSEGITMPVDPDAVLPSEKLYAKLDESSTPSLYVAGSAEMDPESVEYCVATRERCAADQTLWRRMRTYVATGRTDQVFVSDGTLPLDSAFLEQGLSLKAKTRSGGTIVQAVLRLLRQ